MASDRPGEPRSLEVLTRQELDRRPSRPPDREAESDALAVLMLEMETNPDGVLRKCAELALGLCKADSAAIGLIEDEGGLRWRAAAGAFARDLPDATEQAGALREALACGQALLFGDAAGLPPELRVIRPPVHENMLAPLRVEGRALGVLWIVKHAPRSRFEAEDARLLQVLARAAAIGRRIAGPREESQAAPAGAAAPEREERAAAEARLRELEEKHRSALAALDEGFCVIEIIEDAGGRPVDYRYVEVNPAFERHTGLVDVVGKRGSEVTPGDEAHWIETYGGIARSGAPKRFQDHHKGTGRWYDVHASRVGRADAPLVCVVFSDVTGRKLAEDALRQNEERQAFLLKLSDTLRPLSDPSAVKAAAARVLGGHLRVNRAFYAEVEGDDWVVANSYERGVEPSAEGRHPMAPFGRWIIDMFGGGERLIIRDLQADSRFGPSERAAHEAYRIRAAVAVPLVKEGELVAILVVHGAAPRDWSELEIALVEETAERTWSALERARAEEALRASERLQATMLEVLPLGLGLVNLEGRVIHSNPHWARFVPTRTIPSRDEDRSWRWRSWNSEGQPVEPSGYPAARALRGERVRLSMEFLYTDDDGREMWTSVAAVPLTDPSGKVTGAVSIIQDIDAAKRAEGALRESEARQAFLLALGDAMRAQSSANAVIEVAARLLGERLKASRVLFAEFDAARGIADIFHGWFADGAEPFPAVMRLEQYEGPILADLRAGRTVRIEDAGAPFERPDFAAIAEVGVKALLSVPLIVAGRLVVNLSVHQHAPRRWTDDEVALVQEVAERLWADLVRARTEAALRESEARQIFLLRLSDALRRLPDPAQIQGDATRLLREHFAAGWCCYVEWDQAGTAGVVLRDATRPELPSLAGAHDLFDAPAILDLLRSGEALNVSDDASYDLLSPRLRARYSALGFRSMIVAPLVKAGQLIAALVVGDTEVRRWTPTDQAIVMDVAERTWAALERARAETALRENEEKFRTLFDSIDEGLAVVEMIHDDEGEIVDMIFRQINSAYERQGGLYDVVGRSVLEMLPGVEDYWLDLYRRVARTGEPVRVQNYQQDVDRWFDVYFSRVDETGRFVAIVFNDITERKRAEAETREAQERQAFLLRLSDALRAEPDADAVANLATRMLFEQLRLDRCYTSHYRLAEDWADLGHQAGNDAAPPAPDGVRPSDFPDAFRIASDRTLVIDDVAERDDLSDREKRNIIALGQRALIAATLRRGERNPLWAMTAVSARPRRWTRGEVALVEDVAERTWAAMERARSEAALRESEARQAFLLKLSDAIRTLDDPVEIMATVAETVGRHLQVGRCGYAEVPPPYSHLVVARDWTNGSMRSLQGSRPLESFGEEAVAQYRAGKTMVFSDTFEDPRTRDHRDGMEAAGGVRASISVQLMKQDRWVACFYVQDAEPREWTAREIALMEEVAERTWAALERARAEAALRESEERLQLAIAATGLATWDWDIVRGTVVWSDEHYRMHGYEIGEVAPSFEAWAARVHPDDLAATEGALKAARDGRSEYSHTFRALHPDGRVVWLSARGRFYYDGAGLAVRMIGIMEDVTDARRAQEALRRSEERFRSALSLDTVGVLFWDDAFRLTEVNDAFLRMTGFAREEALGKTWRELTPRDFHPASERAIAELAERGEITPYEKQQLRRDGSRWWGLFAMRRLERGGVEYVLDITGRKEAEAALRDSEERFRQFGEASSDVLWIRGIDSLDWEYLSPAFERIYGLDRASALAEGGLRNWLDLIVPEDRAHAAAQIERVRRGETTAFEYRIRRPADGELRWLRNSDFPLLDSSGAVQRIGGVGHDVTEEKRTADRLKVLVAELQHRTRNLLNVIRSVAARTLANSADLEDFRDRFEDRLRALARVNGLLSRLEEGDRITFDELLRTELSGHGVTELDGEGRQVRLSGPSSVSLPSATVQTFALALHELMTNAVKYGALSRPEGRLEIAWAMIEVEGEPRLRVDWRESGVPLEGGEGDGAPSAGSGYGRELIERALPYQLRAESSYDLGPDGLRCVVIVPVSTTFGGPDAR